MRLGQRSIEADAAVLATLIQGAAPSYMYVPRGWNDGWKAAKAASATTPCWMVAKGDSTCFGTNTTNYMTKPWLPLVRADLITRYGLYADFWGSCYSTSFDGSFAGTPPFAVTLDGGTVSWSRLGLSSSHQFSAVGNPSIAFTTPYACTEISLYDFENFGGTWDFHVTNASASATAAKVGTATGAVTPTTPVVGGILDVAVTNTNLTGRTRRIHITGLDNNTHVVTCHGQSGVNVLTINGAACFNPGATGGIGFGWIGRNGAQVPTTTDNGAPSRAFHGQTGAATTHDMGFPTAASLVVAQYGINECQGGTVTAATFRENLQRFIHAWRRWSPDCSFLIIADNNPPVSSGDMTSGWFTNNSVWPAYVAAMYEVAQNHNCALINVHGKWGGTAVTKGFVSATNPHPNDGGQADIAALVGPIL